MLISIGLPGKVSAQLPPQLAAPWNDVQPPAPIAGLSDARPYAPLEFSRAWLGKMAAVRTRRSELQAAGELSGLSPAEAAKRGAALSGVLRVPVIAIRYSDLAPPFPTAVLKERLFGPGSGDTVSYSGYFAEVSNGLLKVEGAVTPWIKLPNKARHYLPAEYYGWGRFGRIAEVREEALRRADPHIDFSQYDNDGPDGVPNSGDDDGFVDFMALTYALPCNGDAREGAIWPHRAAMEPLETKDASARGGRIRVADYVILPAVDVIACSPMHVGLLAHETGHALGLPDLYDYDGSSQGIGHWGLMGTGSHGELYSPAHFSAWEKEQLGWVRVQWIDGDSAKLELPPVHTDPTVYRYDVPEGNGRYLLMENRQRAGSDRHLPGHGLLLWRVDPERGELGAWNNDERRSAVSLIEADGEDLPRGNRADAGDPFPGEESRTEFSSALDGGFRLANIAEHEGVITADMAREEPPSLLPRTPVVRLTALAGGAAVEQVVEIERHGGASFAFNATATQSWLSVRTTGDRVTLRANPGALPPGTHTDTVRLMDDAGASAGSILVSFYVATPGAGQIVATQLPWSWGLAARKGQILQASYGWDQLGLRPKPRVLELREGATHPATLARLPSDALYSPAIDSSGTTYVLSRADGKNYLYRLKENGGADVIASAFGAGPAYGVAALPDGALLVSEYAGRIHRVERDGKVKVRDAVDANLYQIAATPTGDVFAATLSGNILRLGADGSKQTIATGYGQGRLVAVAAAPDGSVIAAERGGHGRIERFDAGGKRELVFQRDGAHFYGVTVDGVFVYALDLAKRELVRIPLPAAARHVQPPN